MRSKTTTYALALGLAVMVVHQGLAQEAAEQPVEATSLTGLELRRPQPPADFAQEQEGKLVQARMALDSDPDDLDALIWVGRRTAYLGRYNEAIQIYSWGLMKHPESPHLYRHRGHRFISTRQLSFSKVFDKIGGLFF